jgi:YebC/PmpR family DNA-binding regulatory protein
MAGHSQFANIKHRKGAVDQKRARVFSTHAKAVMTAARLGGADPKMNARLMLAIEKARADNMPKDKIERAILKGTGQLDGGAQLEDIRYEAYGPGGAALLIEVVTDNRNRTAPELRSMLERSAGRLAESGSVAWMFDARALVVVKAEGIDEEKLTETVLEIGADDLKREGEEFRVLGDPTSLSLLQQGLKTAGYEVVSAEMAMIPRQANPLDLEAAQRFLELIDALEEHEDVQNYFTNAEVPEAVLAQLEKG